MRSYNTAKDKATKLAQERLDNSDESVSPVLEAVQNFQMVRSRPIVLDGYNANIIRRILRSSLPTGTKLSLGGRVKIKTSDGWKDESEESNYFEED